jgi:hypothetical protein
MMTTDKQIQAKLYVLERQTSADQYVHRTALELNEAFTRTRWVAADDMAGTMELAEFFNVNRSTVSNWAVHRGSNGMPEPIVKLGATPVYSLREVAKWWIGWKPSKGAKAGSVPSVYTNAEDL